MMVIQMTENKKKKQRQQKKWLEFQEFLKTDKGKKCALNQRERECKQVVSEYVEKVNDFIAKRTPFYRLFWKAEWRIKKAVDEDILREFGFTKRPKWLHESSRSLDRNVFKNYKEIEMARIIQKYNANQTSLDWTTLECHDLEEQQKAISRVYDIDESFIKLVSASDDSILDPIRLVKILYRLPDDRTAEELLFEDYLKFKQPKPNNKPTKEPLGSKPVSTQRLQYESHGYYTKKCETCDKSITIKGKIPYDYDSNNFHNCFEDGSNKK